MKDNKVMNIEKAIHAVETAFNVWIDEYIGCSWFKEDEVRQAKENALALLKEQEGKIKTLEDKNVKLMLLVNEYLKKEREEAVEPFSDDDGAYWCGSCHYDIVWHQKYCSNCGRPVLWGRRQNEMNNSHKDVVDRNRLIAVLEQQIALCGTDDERDRITVYLTADDARRIVSWLKE